MNILIQFLLASMVMAGACPQTTVIKGPVTLVMEEVGGVPGNAFLTVRNNGEIVDAAFADSPDRQFTPSNTSAGDPVLLLQRSFSPGFRPDLVNAQACLGFNGTSFKAEDCAAPGIRYVNLVGNVLRSGKACHSGHDDKAQITVDPDGQRCASVITTAATPATP